MNRIRASAKGQDCQIRIPGVCNGNPETVVFCHKAGGGMGMKSSDMFGAYGCSACHDEVDGRTRNIEDRNLLRVWFYEGIFRTQQILKQKGLL